MRVVPGSSQRPGRQEEPRAKSEMSRPQRQPYKPCFPQDPCPTSIFLLFLSQFSPAVHVLVAQSGPTLCDPVGCSPLSMELSGQVYWAGLPFHSPGSSLTWASNPGLPPCGQILYHLSHHGNLPYWD